MKTTDLDVYKSLELKVSKACLKVLAKLHSAKPIENFSTYRFSKIYDGFVYTVGVEYYYHGGCNGTVSDIRQVEYRFPESFLLGGIGLTEETEKRGEEYKKELGKVEEDKAKKRELEIKKALEVLERNGVEVK